MPVYSGNGDEGESVLLSGFKLAKDHSVFEALGSIDELNAHIDLLSVKIEDNNLIGFLNGIYARLQDIMSILAGETVNWLAGGGYENKVSDPQQLNNSINQLEAEIDRIESELPPIDRFIRFDKESISAQANLCRTICRRAERSIVKLHQEVNLPEQVLRFMNRLSDYLFMAAVHLHHISR